MFKELTEKLFPNVDERDLDELKRLTCGSTRFDETIGNGGGFFEMRVSTEIINCLRLSLDLGVLELDAMNFVCTPTVERWLRVYPRKNLEDSETWFARIHPNGHRRDASVHPFFEGNIDTLGFRAIRSVLFLLTGNLGVSYRFDLDGVSCIRAFRAGIVRASGDRSLEYAEWLDNLEKVYLEGWIHKISKEIGKKGGKRKAIWTLGGCPKRVF